MVQIEIRFGVGFEMISLSAWAAAYRSLELGVSSSSQPYITMTVRE